MHQQQQKTMIKTNKNGKCANRWGRKVAYLLIFVVKEKYARSRGDDDEKVAVGGDEHQ